MGDGWGGLAGGGWGTSAARCFLFIFGANGRAPPRLCRYRQEAGVGARPTLPAYHGV